MTVNERNTTPLRYLLSSDPSSEFNNGDEGPAPSSIDGQDAENFLEGVKKTVDSFKKAFSFEEIEERYGLAKIKRSLNRLFENSSQAKTNFLFNFFSKKNEQEKQLVALQKRLLNIKAQHDEEDQCYLNEIRQLEIKLSEFISLEKIKSEDKRGALDKLFDSRYNVDIVQSLEKIKQEHLDLVGSFLRLHLHFLKRQIDFFDEYSKILHEYREILYQSARTDYTNSNEDSFDTTFHRISKKLTAVDKVLEKLVFKEAEIQESYDEFVSKKILDKGNWLQIIHNLWQLYKKYYKNPEATLRLVIEALDEVREYILKNPSIQARGIMNNLFLVHKLLIGDDPNVELLARHTEKTLFIDSIMYGFSNNLEKDSHMPENIKKFADILQVLPSIIAVFEGMKAGSFLPLIPMTLFLEGFGCPWAFIVPLFDIVLGALGNRWAVRYIQNVNHILDQDQRLKLVSFLKVLDQKFATMEELQEQRLQMALFRESIKLEKGTPTTHIFQRAFHNLNNFYLKITHANKFERTVRLIGQVTVPALILTASNVAVVAAFIGLAPAGVVVISALFAAAATIAGGTYSAYQVGHLLGRWIDEWYHETVKNVNEITLAADSTQKLNQFLKDNKDILKKLVKITYGKIKSEVHAGRYDSLILSPEFEAELGEKFTSASAEDQKNIKWRRKKFLQIEKEKNKVRMEAATFIDAYQLKSHEIEILCEKVFCLKEGTDALMQILAPSDPAFSDKTLLELASQEGIPFSERRLHIIRELREDPQLWAQLLQAKA